LDMSVAPMKLKTRHKMLIARCLRWPLVAYRKCFNLSRAFKVNRNGINWLLDLDEGIDLSIYLFGCFEPSTTAALKRLVKSGYTVLDIGANVGCHTLTLAKLVGATGQVVAFEPTLYAFEKATENLRLNPRLSSVVRLEQIILTEYDNNSVPESLYSSWPLVENKAVHEKHCGLNKSTAGARAMTLDEYLAASNIRQVNLIKLDVDGYECKVLRGAKQVLTKNKPVIVMELCPYVLEENGSSLPELVDILRSADYKVYDEKTEQQLPLEVAGLNRLVDDGHGINIIARL